MDIDELTILDLYNQKDDKVIAALLLVWKLGWTILLRSFICSFVSFVILPIILLFRYQLRCREPVTQQAWREIGRASCRERV